MTVVATEKEFPCILQYGVPVKSDLQLDIRDWLGIGMNYADFDYWKQVRFFWFRRSSYSGKLINPFENSWYGMVLFNDTYTFAWLTNSEYLLQKLKGIL